LEVEWSSGTREVDSLVQHFLGVELTSVHKADRRLSSTW